MLVRQLICNCTRSYSSSRAMVLEKGHLLKLSRTFSDSDVTDYSKLSFDSNPLHFNVDCARNAGFQDRPVPGMLVATLFPRIIAFHFLKQTENYLVQHNPGAIYVSQTLQFKLPVYTGEDIVGVVQATNIREIKNKYMVKFETKCFNGIDMLVIDGEAKAVLPTLNIEHV
ncbi:hypothetical protein OROGR_032011 [Orobanche gracilis]